MGEGNAVWPLVLEKAFAKMQGNYLNITSGSSSMGMRYLKGGPWDEVDTMYMSPDQIFNYIAEQLSAGHNVTTGAGKGKTMTDAWGIVKDHAYTVSGVVTVNKNGDKLIKCRNPWGEDSYFGLYGAFSPQA